MSNNPLPGFGALSYWMPAKICYPSSARLHQYCPISMRSQFDALKADGWRFYVTQSNLGYCHQDKKVITIPLAVFGQSVDAVAYMIAHEMAHARTACDLRSHGVEWLANFMAIAPQKLWPMEPAYNRMQSARSQQKKLVIQVSRAGESTSSAQSKAQVASQFNLSELALVPTLAESLR